MAPQGCTTWRSSARPAPWSDWSVYHIFFFQFDISVKHPSQFLALKRKTTCRLTELNGENHGTDSAAMVCSKLFSFLYGKLRRANKKSLYIPFHSIVGPSNEDPPHFQDGPTLCWSSKSPLHFARGVEGAGHHLAGGHHHHAHLLQPCLCLRTNRTWDLVNILLRYFMSNIFYEYLSFLLV